MSISHITTKFLNIKIHKKNSVTLVREQTIPTERPPPVGEVSANFCGQRGVTWSAQRFPTAVLISVFQTGAATYYSSSSSIDLMRLSGPRSRPTTTQKIWQLRESNPRPLYLQPETLTTRPQRRSNIKIRRIIILPVDLNGYGTWYFTVMEPNVLKIEKRTLTWNIWAQVKYVS